MKLASAALGAALLVACSSGSSAPSDSAGCFLAFNSQFEGFRTWTSFTYDGVADDDAGIHVAGPRTEYIKQAPEHGSTSFAQGTLIVKEVGANDPTNHHVFAMVKRGCNFNSSGASGWEWMEIKEDGASTTIIWRGVGPPAGEMYGGDPAGCNSCHAACTSNDSVCSSKLRLSAF